MGKDSKSNSWDNPGKTGAVGNYELCAKDYNSVMLTEVVLVVSVVILIK